MRVLLAVGSPHLTSILRSHIVKADYEVLDNDVLHINFLQEIIEIEEPTVIILHDHYLPSDKPTKEDREKEMLELIQYWRSAYDDSIRIVYMCERERKDPFLAQLVARNVLDIFNERQISVDRFIEQLKSPPRFANVSRFGVGNIIQEFKEEPIETPIETTIEDVVEEVTEDIAVEISVLPIEEEVDGKLDELDTQAAEPKLVVAESKKKPSIRINLRHSTEVEKVKVSIDRKIIAVVSPFERSGTSFVAHQLAYQVAKQNIGVTYYENPLRRPYTYDRLGGHLSVPKYQSLYTDIEDGLEEIELGEQTSWKVDGVSIQALNPELERPLEENDLSVSRYLRMFLSAHDTPYLIVDIGSDESKEIYDEIIEIASHIVIVVDSDIPNLEWFEQYKLAPRFDWIHNVLEDKRAIVVANRFTEGMEAVIPVDDFIAIPSFDDEWVFQSQLNGQFAFTKREAVKKQDHTFRKLVEAIVPKEELNRVGGSASNNVFRKVFPKINIENTN